MTTKDNNIKYRANPDSYYQQFEDYKKPVHDYKKVLELIPKLKADLKKIGVTLYFLKWNEYSTGQYQIRNFFEENENKLKSNYIIITEKSIYIGSIKKNGHIVVFHDIQQNLIDQFNKVLIKYFPKKTVGIQTKYDTIQIFYQEQKKFIKEKNKSIIDVKFHIKNLETGFPYEDHVKKLNSLPKSIGYYTNVQGYYDKKIYMFIVTFYINEDKVKLFFDFLKENKKQFSDIVKIEILKDTEEIYTDILKRKY
jgi:hypothetical protein